MNSVISVSFQVFKKKQEEVCDIMDIPDYYYKFYESVQYLCSCIVLFQFCIKFLPWFYAYYIGPYITDANIKFYGKWARKFNILEFH